MPEAEVDKLPSRFEAVVLLLVWVVGKSSEERENNGVAAYRDDGGVAEVGASGALTLNGVINLAGAEAFLWRALRL